MGNARPFTEAHAIAAVDIALIFTDELSTAQRSSISDSLASHLTDFRRAESRKRKEKVIAFERRVDDDLAEAVHIHGNYVHVISFDYRGWSITKGEMIGRIEPVFEMAQSQNVVIESAGLVFRDVFINEDPDTFAARDVFDPGSRFLPSIAFSAEKRWRSSFSWRSEIKGLRVRSNLTLEASLDPIGEGGDDAHVTEITHRQEIFGNESGSSSFEWDAAQLSRKLDGAHQLNKDILADLLSSEMSSRIGLKEGS